jgi:hypothetical protein
LNWPFDFLDAISRFVAIDSGWPLGTVRACALLAAGMLDSLGTWRTIIGGTVALAATFTVALTCGTRSPMAAVLSQGGSGHHGARQ